MGEILTLVLTCGLIRQDPLLGRRKGTCHVCNVRSAK